jgi:hypothetical protein
LPDDAALEGMMTKWLLSGDEGDWRRARSLAVERDSLRRLYELGTGQSCFQRFPPILKEGPVVVGGGAGAAAAGAAAAAAVGGVGGKAVGSEVDEGGKEEEPRPVWIEERVVVEVEAAMASSSVGWGTEEAKDRGLDDDGGGGGETKKEPLS